ncbi:MAG: BrnT family toxin [Terriglobales bacterium]
MEFEWDRRKAEANLKKHGVSFTEALTVFADPLEITISDPDHSGAEMRFLSLGCSERRRLLIVAYTERGSRTRIIHARKAASKERKAYATGTKKGD